MSRTGITFIVLDVDTDEQTFRQILEEAMRNAVN